MQTAMELEQALHSLIPISVAMGVSVTEWDGSTLCLSAPLENNINHQSSAFGGSLFSLAAMAGWGILQLRLSALKLDANIVIADGNVRYRQPVFAQLTCRLTLPEDDIWSEFVDQLSKTGKSKLTLCPELILPGGEVAMALEGHYVVMLKPDE